MATALMGHSGFCVTRLFASQRRPRLSGHPRPRLLASHPEGCTRVLPERGSPLAMTQKTPAYGARAAKAPVAPMTIERRDPGPHDVEIEILYCGICHSDVHKVNDDWGNTQFPVVPGHEIVGRVVSQGARASRYREGDRVGVGGVGHMAVKLAKSMGADVTVLSTSPGKAEAAARLGAKAFVATREPGALEPLEGTFDLIVDTVSAPHDLDKPVALLRPFGTMVLLGLPPNATSATPINASSLVFGNKRLAGSNIGGIPETQEMLDHCGKNGIVADVEIIRGDQINLAYKRMLQGDVRYRFVIDCASIGASAGEQGTEMDIKRN